MIIDCNDAPIEMNERQSARAMNEIPKINRV